MHYVHLSQTKMLLSQLKLHYQVRQVPKTLVYQAQLQAWVHHQWVADYHHHQWVEEAAVA